MEDSDIGAAHKLPDSKKVKNRMAVKFLQREKREEVYKKRKNLVGKNTCLVICLRNRLRKQALEMARST